MCSGHSTIERNFWALIAPRHLLAFCNIHVMSAIMSGQDRQKPGLAGGLNDFSADATLLRSLKNKSTSWPNLDQSDPRRRSTVAALAGAIQPRASAFTLVTFARRRCRLKLRGLGVNHVERLPQFTTLALCITGGIYSGSERAAAAPDARSLEQNAVRQL